MPTAAKTPALKTLRPRRFTVNKLTNAAEFEFTGTLNQGRLEKKVRGFFAEMERRAPGSYTPTPKSLWRLSFDSNVAADKYTVQVALKHTVAFDAALDAFNHETRGF